MPRWRRAMRHLLSLVIVGGVVLALWPVGQFAYGVWSQRQLRSQWQAAARRVPVHKPNFHRARAPVKREAHSKRTHRREAPPWPMTRIIAPDIGLDAVVVQGTDTSSLREGPGHEPLSAAPGQPGKCIIAGHRNMYGSWFSRLNELQTGSMVTLKSPYHTWTYQVVAVNATVETDTTVSHGALDAAAPATLVLYSCTLPYSTGRIVATAQLVAAE